MESLKRHWQEYAIEAAGLGLFMIVACSFTVLLEHPGSPFRASLPALARRLLMGTAMGSTAIAIIYSRWGKRSGAHINPAVTLTFFRLGKIEAWDASFYVLAQFTGAVVGVLVSMALLRHLVSEVSYAATVPGALGVPVAFAAELAMAFVMMTMILRVTNQEKLARFTGLFAGILVATFITIEAPISGMSINPARTLGSAVSARLWTALWLYFLAPPLGMMLAAELYRRGRGRSAVRCAKLHHQNDEPCIFRCGYART